MGDVQNQQQTCVLTVSSSGATHEDFKLVSSNNTSNHVLSVTLSPVVSFKIFDEVFDGMFEIAAVPSSDVDRSFECTSISPK